MGIPGFHACGATKIYGATVDGQAKSESPVDNAGKHPMICRLSIMSGGDFATATMKSRMV